MISGELCTTGCICLSLFKTCLGGGMISFWFLADNICTTKNPSDLPIEIASWILNVPFSCAHSKSQNENTLELTKNHSKKIHLPIHKTTQINQYFWVSLSLITLGRLENNSSPRMVCHYARTDDPLDERLKYWMEIMYTTRNGLVTATVRHHTCMQYYNVHSAAGGKEPRKKPSHYPNLPTDIIGWLSQTQLKYSLPKPFCVLLYKPSILEASMLCVCMPPSQHRQAKTRCYEGKLKYWINKTSTIDCFVAFSTTWSKLW